MPARKSQYCWGVWLTDLRQWMVLPARMQKPTPHNCDLNAGLIDVMRKAIADGHEPELKRIPEKQLKIIRAEYR